MMETKHVMGKAIIDNASAIVGTLRSEPGASNSMTANIAGNALAAPASPHTSVARIKSVLGERSPIFRSQLALPSNHRLPAACYTIGSGCASPFFELCDARNSRKPTSLRMKL
jgi:hypothetical protein